MQRKKLLPAKIFTASVWYPIGSFVCALLTMAFVIVFHDTLDSNPDQGECKVPSIYRNGRNCLAQMLDPGNIEGFSVLWLGFLYVFERDRRKKDSQYAAWRIIDQAASAKVPTSRARLMALEDLNRDQVSLKGIDLVKADLEDINLQGAKLLKADMRQTVLKSANLQRADFTEARLDEADMSLASLNKAVLEVACCEKAKLVGAELVGARLSEANLDQSDMSGANLTGAFLSRANLSKVDFSGADLTNASFNEANLEGAKFFDAELKGAKFRHVRHLTPEQVKEARNWELASYDDGLSHELGLL
ncbi:pentapeptide repeat-containing protein [Oscillatoria sp. FACHB-1407]|uniref:pentapeptide repeat-containing protein n=1 Tax=Oscillatoria sp. FACHB-1407 TaxID=2692847 RepID=UPI0016821DCE|nr:pentapeptide repeat-containing protein [Oscillatoria sp. FACHB-1407]MBD2461548.1 pentapeptide repeat-containing protein [Oscillatoria sp. FACHB-1407]